MSKMLTTEFVQEKAQIVKAPEAKNRVATNVDRDFGLPKTLYGATIACYLGFVAITALAFANPGLIIPMVIIAGIIVAGFVVPGIWTQLKPETKSSNAVSYDRFNGEGIMTHTGPLKARDAATQVLILPVLVLFWGVAVVTIVALAS
ncbi:hypothetical protein [Altererythrobacter ishigakiensis]|uniref:Uncharacterized protein n=1 Tax=Altererythrobacter ishigakiensis TaxID=476157 RepID=A0A562UVL9_9SPHN|nr:hypothetical protein [Altererythrobacter ishigakiensis]TWJ09653.1 hypothetical protein JN10_1292 [Altererythrobacter ishigakiensis]